MSLGIFNRAGQNLFVGHALVKIFAPPLGVIVLSAFDHHDKFLRVDKSEIFKMTVKTSRPNFFVSHGFSLQFITNSVGLIKVISSELYFKSLSSTVMKKSQPAKIALAT